MLCYESRPFPRALPSDLCTVVLSKCFRTGLLSGPQGLPSWLFLPPLPRLEVLSQVARMLEGPPPTPRPAHQAFTAQLGEPDKEADLMPCEECKVESARLPWEQRGACNHKNENSSLHLCIAFSFSKSWVWREGGGGGGRK